MNQRLTDLRRAQLDQLLSGGTNMAGGGLLKAVAKAAQKVLPAVEREANLAKFLAESKTPMRLYHGTTSTEGGKGQEAISRIKPSKEGSLGSGVYLTPNSDFAGSYAGYSPSGVHQTDSGAPSSGGNVLPVHAQIKNPLFIEGTHGDPMIEALVKLGMDEDKASRMVERAYDQKGYIGKEVESRARAAGYDGLAQYRNGELSEVVAFDPNTVKSAIGNQGTYDTSVPDLNKAGGGLIHLAGGGDPKKADSQYTLMGDPSQFTESSESKLYPKTERMNRGVKAIKSGLDSFNRFIDQGPSVRDVLGSVVGAVPFVGPDLRKGMEESTLTIPYEFQRSATNPKVATGVNTAKVPTTDILDALKMSDITGGTGASNLLGSVGKGYAPDPMDVLDTLGLGAVGYGAAKVAGKGAMKAARAGERLAGKAVPKIMERGGLGAEMLGALGQNTQSRAVKQKGGNWVDTEVQRGLKKFKQDDSYPESFIKSVKEDLAGYEGQPQYADDADRMRRDLAHMEQTNAFNKWVDTKAGSYVRNQMATPDDPVIKMLDVRSAKIEADYQAGQKRLAKLDERIAQAPANTTEEQNTLANLKRTRSQRAAEIESDRELAMNSMLPNGKDYSGYGYLKNDAATLINEREKAGFPIAGYGQSDAAKAWEATADFTANINPASKFQGQAEKIAVAKDAEKAYNNYMKIELPDKFKEFINKSGLPESDKQALIKNTPSYHMKEMMGGEEKYDEIMNNLHQAREQVNMAAFGMAEDNPYLAKLPPETPVYNAFGFGDLGIDHIIDVLKDDVATGKLKLEDLNKITMDQAVKRAAEYDFEMAKKARDAVAQSRATMPVYKEYPEGYKWVQLTKPGEFNAESNAMGHSVRGYEPPRGHPDWTPESGDSGDLDYGHSGWEGIKSGQAKVYSLVDPSGKPHTTIEVKANPNPYPVSGEAFAMLPSKTKAEYGQYVREWRQRNPDIEELTDEHTTQALKEAGVPPQPDIITQIKGKGNARPSEKYDQYTQDFVRSGKWSDVDDLKNTGLYPISKDYLGHTSSWVPEAEDVKHLTRQQRMEALAKAVDAGELPEKGYVTRSELDDALRKHGRPTYAEDTDELLRQLQPPEQGMAGGGSVGLKNALNNLLRTDKPEVHMAGGGVMAKVAKAAKAAAKVDHPLVFPRAVPKSLEEIRPIAQRMAEQMTGDFVKQNPKLTTNPAGKSRKQFEREQNIPLETRNVVPERAAPDVNYEDYMGYGVVGVPGDPTLGGVAKRGSLEEVAQPTVELTRVGDITPDYPVPLFGGPRYGDDEKFWASNFGAAVPIQKNASKLADEYQSPIIAKYIKMGSGSENFALHNLDALLAIQRPERLDKAKMARLTEVIQAGSPKYGKFPGFTGFEEPIDVLLQAQMDSNLRKHIAETLTKPTITNELGLANGLDVVAAITHPELRNLETGASGFSVGKMKPSAKLQRGESSHPTYDTDIPGSFLGRSKYPTPYEIAFPDTTAYARSQMTPGVQEFNMMKMLGPRERIDQQYIDEIKMYEELMKKYTGKKKGGLAQTKKVKRHGNTVPH